MQSYLTFLSDPMVLALKYLAEHMGAGMAIIVLTVVIRLLLFPLVQIQLRSARNMQALQPHIQEIRKKYGKDRQKVTEETMKLYKEHKVNPASGCLPLLIQMPVLFALYYALYGPLSADPQFQGGFLWIAHLNQPDHIIPFLCVITQFVQQKMMTQKSTDPQQQMMNQMMQFMPLMVGFFAWSMPAGLPLYWTVSNVFGAVQQYFITGWGTLPVPESWRRLRERMPSLAPAPAQAPPPERIEDATMDEDDDRLGGPNGAAPQRRRRRSKR